MAAEKMAGFVVTPKICLVAMRFCSEPANLSRDRSSSQIETPEARIRERASFTSSLSGDSFDRALHILNSESKLGKESFGVC